MLALSEALGGGTPPRSGAQLRWAGGGAAPIGPQVSFLRWRMLRYVCADCTQTVLCFCGSIVAWLCLMAGWCSTEPIGGYGDWGVLKWCELETTVILVPPRVLSRCIDVVSQLGVG